MRHEFWTVVRFGVVGGLATVTHVICAFVMLQYQPPIVANTVAFVVAFVVSYAGHQLWTFRGASHAKRSLPRFLGVAIAALAISNCVLVLLLRFQVEMGLAVVVAAVFVPVTSYVLSRIWAFSRSPIQSKKIV